MSTLNTKKFNVLFSDLITQLSAITNIQNLISTSKNETEITCLYGIRCLAMSWIILYHTFVLSALAPLLNQKYFIEVTLY